MVNQETVHFGAMFHGEPPGDVSSSQGTRPAAW
jgi:hypothetical protein